MLPHIMNRGDRRERISMDDAGSSASATRRTIFRYDGKRRRRVTREETKGSSGQWVLASETRYVYDGMRVIQERNGNGVPTVAYTRGPDLSGTLEGAGGIGQLLARSEWDGSAWSRHAFYHSDGVGNVTALAVPNGNDIALAGSYRYDPFGRLIGTPTDLAARNTQRFSSKDWHNPSGFYYFGYRFYDPATQRWLNRDPIDEQGGINLYRFAANSPVVRIDKTGLDIWIEGANENEPPLHQSVCVGDPSGEYTAYSFGATGEWIYGEVYIDDEHGGKIKYYKKRSRKKIGSLSKRWIRKTGTQHFTELMIYVGVTVRGNLQMRQGAKRHLLTDQRPPRVPICPDHPAKLILIKEKVRAKKSVLVVVSLRATLEHQQADEDCYP